MDEELRKILMQLLEGQEGLKLGQEALEKEVRKNSETIVSLEEKMMQRTEALFDGYKANTEKLEKISEKIDDLRLDVNNLGIKTLKTENNVIELNKRIAK
jgi:seryl-tRNA synthetase